MSNVSSCVAKKKGSQENASTSLQTTMLNKIDYMLHNSSAFKKYSPPLMVD